MCRISDMLYDEGRIAGVTKCIINLTARLPITDDAAMELLGIDEKDRPMYADYVKEMRQEMATVQ